MSGRSPGAVLAALSGQDRVVVIRRPFVDWLGSIEAALLLDQCLFEADRAGDQPFSVRDEDWRVRLLLSQHRLRAARDTLVGLGLLTVERVGVPARLSYRMDTAKVFDQFARFLGLETPVVRKRTTGDANTQNKQRENAELSIYEVGCKEKEKNTAPEQAGRWQPVQAEIARSLGAPTATTKTGRPLSWVGQLTRQVGEAAGGDPDRAGEVWAAFLAALSPDERERFLTPKSAGSRFGRWALNGGGQTIAAIVGTGGLPSGWTFTGADGRPRLKAPAVLIAEGKLPPDCDPLDPDTWPSEYAAARKAVGV